MRCEQFVISFVLAGVAAFTTTIVGAERASQTSTLCRFTAGPRAGETQDYAPMAALPVGTACQDGAGSSGVVVAPDAGQRPGGGTKPQMSTLCKFTAGPRAGQTQDYAPMAGIPVGSPCQDGAGSTGTVIAPDAGQKGGGAKAQMSTLCKFTAGPRAGQTQDYAPMAGIPVGSPCQDGAGSTGTVIAPPTTQKPGAGAKPQLSTLCKFTAGPRAGQTQDYAPMQAIPVGSPCQDGAGSTGTVIGPGGR